MKNVLLALVVAGFLGGCSSGFFVGAGEEGKLLGAGYNLEIGQQNVVGAAFSVTTCAGGECRTIPEVIADPTVDE